MAPSRLSSAGSQHLNRKVVQIFALTVLIGAPMLVDGLTRVLPGQAPATPAAPAPKPYYLQAAPDPMAGLPQALPDPHPAPPGGSGDSVTSDPAMSSEPMVDPSAATASIEPSAPAPTEPVASAMPAADASLAVNQGPPPANMMPKFREGPVHER